MTAWLDPVRASLDEAEAPVDVFFRDDDAGWDDDRLRALLDLFAARELPLDLAVIPTALTPRAARELRARASELLGFHQHGLAHANHESSGRRCEFGPSRSRAQQLDDVAEGRRLLETLLPGLVDSIFTPPWNRCTEETAECLAELGLETLSREAGAPPFGVSGLAELPVNVDWLKRRHGRALTRPEVGLALAAAMRRGGAVGLMLHHAAMTDASRTALSELLHLLASHPAVRASRMTVLLPTPEAIA